MQEICRLEGRVQSRKAKEMLQSATHTMPPLFHQKHRHKALCSWSRLRRRQEHIQHPPRDSLESDAFPDSNDLVILQYIDRPTQDVFSLRDHANVVPQLLSKSGIEAVQDPRALPSVADVRILLGVLVRSIADEAG